MKGKAAIRLANIADSCLSGRWRRLYMRNKQFGYLLLIIGNYYTIKN